MRTAISTGHREGIAQSRSQSPRYPCPSETGRTLGTRLGIGHGCVVDRGKICSVDRALEVAGSSPGAGRTNTQVLKLTEK